MKRPAFRYETVLDFIVVAASTQQPRHIPTLSIDRDRRRRRHKVEKQRQAALAPNELAILEDERAAREPGGLLASAAELPSTR